MIFVVIGVKVFLFVYVFIYWLFIYVVKICILILSKSWVCLGNIEGCGEKGFVIIIFCVEVF